MTHRSAVEEWQPHAKQTDFSQEWWYTTAFFHDAKGQLYSLMFTDFKQDGKKVPVLMSNPQLVPLLRPDTTITHYLLGFSNYDTGYRNPNAGLVVNNVSHLWQPKTNALNYDCKGITGSWSFDKGGDKMTLVLDYHNNTQPTKTCHLTLT